MAKQRYIYFSQQSPNKGQYEIIRDGQSTGELVTPSFIRDRLLTYEQYKAFLNGQVIFHVDANKYRKRNFNKGRAFFSGKRGSQKK